MASLTITIDDELVATLTGIAADNELTNEQYASGIVTTFLTGQLQGSVKAMLVGLTPAQLNDVGVAVSEVITPE
jgi:hypothetical protein